MSRHKPHNSVLTTRVQMLVSVPTSKAPCWPTNGDAVIFNEMVPYLAQNLTVCTFDRRGYSNSTLTTNDPADLEMPQRLQHDADDAAALLSHVSGGESALVFGTSAGAIVGLETHAMFDGIHQAFLTQGIEAATAGFLGPGAASSTDVETQAAYHTLVDPQALTTLWPGPHRIPDLSGLKDKFVMAIGEKCNIPSCNISTILASETGTELYATPRGHLGYVSEPQGFASKTLP
ncbi:abhydrolase [Diaporthe helianthi]|uniref:Abhydrolase n=1 Tax=Diaporthe helianthi TaxID=158607 RepID=A0A2P5IAV9_DIAHE|nr:abhydrolase [Diaporthe helianthi]